MVKVGLSFFSHFLTNFIQYLVPKKRKEIFILVKIFIDSGHGGHDGGATGNGLKEKDVTLKIAKAIQSQLGNYQNVSVKMSRTSDQYLSLGQRTNMANAWGADALVSVHINASTSSSAEGFESYVYPNVGSRTASLQDYIHDETVKQISKFGAKNRGQKRADFHMLRESGMEAVLTENLFISNSGDASLLKQSNFINAVATGHVNGLARFFGLKKKASSTPAPSKPSTGKLFYVQIGAFSEKVNADRLEAKAKKDGYNVFVKKEGSLYYVQIGAFSNEKNANALKAKAEKDGYNVFVKEE
jgi:N-acetylmuramoyl-L-alanine amidase